MAMTAMTPQPASAKSIAKAISQPLSGGWPCPSVNMGCSKPTRAVWIRMPAAKQHTHSHHGHHEARAILLQLPIRMDTLDGKKLQDCILDDYCQKHGYAPIQECGIAWCLRGEKGLVIVPFAHFSSMHETHPHTRPASLAGSFSEGMHAAFPHRLAS